MTTIRKNTDPNVAVYRGTGGANATDSSSDVLLKVTKGVGQALEMGGHSVVGVISPVKLDGDQIVQQLVDAFGAVFEVTHCMPDLIVLLTTDKVSSIAIRVLYVGSDGGSRVTLENNSKVVAQVPAPVKNTNKAAESPASPRPNKDTRRPASPRASKDYRSPASPRPSSPKSVTARPEDDKSADKAQKAPVSPSKSSTKAPVSPSRTSPKAPANPSKRSPASPQSNKTQPKSSSNNATNNNTDEKKEDKGARVIVAFDDDNLDIHLNSAIVEACTDAIKARGVFTVAFGGDDLPALLASIKDAFDNQDIDPQLEKWHVLLADEGCVPLTHNDSNLNALLENVFDDLEVPSSQVYGINQSLLGNGAEAVASDYENTVKSVLAKSGGHLDLAVLGFGPDGHTCSLFPGHALLQEDTKLVASLTDSPEAPSSRITLTLPVLQNMTRNVIVCGGGSGKGSVLRNVFKSLEPDRSSYTVPRGAAYKVTLDSESPAAYPCSMAVPSTPHSTLTWVVDKAAMDEAHSAPSPY